MRSMMEKIQMHTLKNEKVLHDTNQEIVDLIKNMSPK